MMNSTETFWDIDGVSLQNYAWNITTLGGDRLAPPSLRGDDVVIPYMPGALHVPKVPDRRVIPLGMWVNGANPDGSLPQTESARRAFDRNWSDLRSLLWRYRDQFTLTKRFWIPTADLTAANATGQAIRTEGSWSLIQASTKASFGGGLQPSMHGPAGAAFAVDLVLTDPYFYGTALTTSFTVASPTRAISVLGDDRTHKINMSFTGPLTNPRLTLTGYEGSPWTQYNAALVSGAVAALDVKNFSAVKTQSGVATPVSGLVQHSGSPFWAFLDPKETSITMSVSSGTGSASLTYQPAWL